MGDQSQESTQEEAAESWLLPQLARAAAPGATRTQPTALPRKHQSTECSSSCSCSDGSSAPEGTTDSAFEGSSLSSMDEEITEWAAKERRTTEASAVPKCFEFKTTRAPKSAPALPYLEPASTNPTSSPCPEGRSKKTYRRVTLGDFIDPERKNSKNLGGGKLTGGSF